MKAKVWTVYFFGLHCIIIFVLFFPEKVIKAYHKAGILEYSSGHDYYMDFQWNSYAKRSKTLKKESNQLVFFGNSLTNGLCVESLFQGVNMGVSGETIKNAKHKIKSIENLENKRIVVSFGINDIPGNTSEIVNDYEEFISYLPESSTVYISSVLPIHEEAFRKNSKENKTNKQIEELNKKIEELCNTKRNIIFINSSKYLNDSSGQLGHSFHLGDGLHLNEEGNFYWAKGLFEGMEMNAEGKFLTRTEYENNLIFPVK